MPKRGKGQGRDAKSTKCVSRRYFDVCYDLYEIRHCICNQSGELIYEQSRSRTLGSNKVDTQVLERHLKGLPKVWVRKTYAWRFYRLRHHNQRQPREQNFNYQQDASNTWGGASRRRGSNRVRPSRQNNSTQCGYCGKFGHYEVEYRKKKSESTFTSWQLTNYASKILEKCL